MPGIIEDLIATARERIEAEHGRSAATEVQVADVVSAVLPPKVDLGWAAEVMAECPELFDSDERGHGIGGAMLAAVRAHVIAEVSRFARDEIDESEPSIPGFR